MRNLIGILKFLTLTDDMNTINANQYRKPDKGVANILLDWELNHEQHISSINNWCLFCVKYKHKKFLGFEQVPPSSSDFSLLPVLVHNSTISNNRGGTHCGYISGNTSQHG